MDTRVKQRGRTRGERGFKDDLLRDFGA